NLDLLFELGNRRQIKMTPALLLEQVTNQIALMQALHHHDNGTAFFVVEPRQQGAAIPLDGPRPRRLRHAIRRFGRVVNDNDVAAAPGQNATHEVASRKPRSVVMNSVSVFLLGSILVPGNTRSYHGEVITARQSLPCLVARSWA